MIVGLSYAVIGEQKIHCLGCEARIRAELRELHGVHEVIACADEQGIAISINTELVTSTQVEQRLKEMGYQLVSA